MAESFSKGPKMSEKQILEQQGYVQTQGQPMGVSTGGNESLLTLLCKSICLCFVKIKSRSQGVGVIQGPNESNSYL